MKKRAYLVVPLFALMGAGVVSAQEQFPIADMIASNLVTKYQNATCEQLWQERMEKQGKPKTPQEEQLIQILRTNPAMRAHFINKIAAPVVNKMFECGMIP